MKYKKQIISLFLIIFIILSSFLISHHFKRSFLLEWDSFEYQKDIIFNTRSNLQLGRLGFIKYFNVIYKILSKKELTTPFSFYKIVQINNIIFSSILLLFLYLTISNLYKSKLIAFATSVLFLWTKDFIYLSSSGLTDIMMYCFIMASIYFFYKALDNKTQNKLLFTIISSILFAISINVREQALLFIPFYLINIFYQAKEKDKFLKIFPKENIKVILIFFIISIPLGLLSSADIYFREGDYFLKTLFQYKPIVSTESIHLIRKFAFFKHVAIMIPYWVLSIIGLIIHCIKKKKNALLFNGGLLFSSLIIIYIAFDYIYRNNFFMLIIVILLSVYAVVEILSFIELKIKNKLKHNLKQYFTITFTILLISVFIFLTQKEFNDYFHHLDKVSISNREYGEKMTYKIPEKTVLIVGSKTGLLGLYYYPLSGSEKKVIWPYDSWPDERIGDIIQSYLDQKYRIIIDFQYLSSFEKEDILNVFKKPNIKMVRSQGLYIILP